MTTEDSRSVNRMPAYLTANDGGMANSMRNHPAAQLARDVDQVQWALEDTLTQVADAASKAIPGADGAGVTLLDDDRCDTIVASAYFVRVVDAIQYNLREGPCITAAAERRTVRSGGLTDDYHWPEFGGRIRGLGVESVLSLPLQINQTVLGTINVYGCATDAFDVEAVQVGERFAQDAAVSVEIAHIVAQRRRRGTDAGLLGSKATIEQGKTILMRRHLCTAAEADAMLKEMSRLRNETLLVAALSVITRQEHLL